MDNTNPMLDESSPEYRELGVAGWEMAEDGWRLRCVETVSDLPILSTDELKIRLLQVGQERYHHQHPFHLMTHDGKLSRGQKQA